MKRVRIFNDDVNYFVESESDITLEPDVDGVQIVHINGFEIQVIDRSKSVAYDNIRRWYYTLRINKNLIIEFTDAPVIDVDNPAGVLPGLLDLAFSN